MQAESAHIKSTSTKFTKKKESTDWNLYNSDKITLANKTKFDYFDLDRNELNEKCEQELMECKVLDFLNVCINGDDMKKNYSNSFASDSVFQFPMWWTKIMYAHTTSQPYTSETYFDEINDETTKANKLYLIFLGENFNFSRYTLKISAFATVKHFDIRLLIRDFLLFLLTKSNFPFIEFNFLSSRYKNQFSA